MIAQKLKQKYFYDIELNILKAQNSKTTIQIQKFWTSKHS